METILVETLDYKTAEAPDTLRSGGIGPCIVVGAINGKQGYMAHYVPQSENYLTKLLTDLKKDVDNLRTVKIYAIGGGVDEFCTIEERDQMLEGRKLTLEMIAQAGFKRRIRKIQWNNKPTVIQEMILDLKHGKMNIEEDLIEDLIDYSNDVNNNY